MTITREQVADLRPGDVVELRLRTGTVIRGPLTVERFCDGLGIAGAGWLIRDSGGGPSYHLDDDAADLTVVRRAPRPLYVNHDRAQPVAGDVVRDADSDRDPRTWVRNAEGFSHEWMTGRTHAYVPREDLPDRLRLLVDGETGQVVP